MKTSNKILHRPRVTVLMAVYNGQKYLREAIDSILAQSFTDFEFVIIDDGSVDGTAEILHYYAQRDERIRIHRQTNQGLIAALNKGLELARGEYIARMDADDVSLPLRLAKQVDLLDANPDIGVLGCSIQLIDEYGNQGQILRFPPEHGLLRWQLCFECPIAHPSVMIKRKVVGSVGGYAPDMVHVEDYDLWRRLNGVTRFSNLRDILLYLRKHETNVTKEHISEHKRNCIRVNQQIITEILREEVPIVVIERLRYRELKTAYDARQSADLVCRLYQTIITDGELSLTEKDGIRRDAAMRLWDLTRPWVKNISVWGLLAQAFYLDPLLVLRLVKRRLMYLSKNRPCPLRWTS